MSNTRWTFITGSTWDEDAVVQINNKSRKYREQEKEPKSTNKKSCRENEGLRSAEYHDEIYIDSDGREVGCVAN